MRGTIFPCGLLFVVRTVLIRYFTVSRAVLLVCHATATMATKSKRAGNPGADVPCAPEAPARMHVSDDAAPAGPCREMAENSTRPSTATSVVAPMMPGSFAPAFHIASTPAKRVIDRMAPSTSRLNPTADEADFPMFSSISLPPSPYFKTHVTDMKPIAAADATVIIATAVCILLDGAYTLSKRAKLNLLQANMLCCIGAISVLDSTQSASIDCSAFADLRFAGYSEYDNGCYVCQSVGESNDCKLPNGVPDPVEFEDRSGCTINDYECLACPQTPPVIMELNPGATVYYSTSCTHIVDDGATEVSVVVTDLDMIDITVVGLGSDRSIMRPVEQFPLNIGPGFAASGVTFRQPLDEDSKTAPRGLLMRYSGSVDLDDVHAPTAGTLLTARPVHPSKLSSEVNLKVSGSSADALAAISHVRGKIELHCTNPNNTVVVQQLHGDKAPAINQDHGCRSPIINLGELLNVFGKHYETEFYQKGSDQQAAPAAALFLPQLTIATILLLVITLLGHEGDILRMMDTLSNRQQLHPVREKHEFALQEEDEEHE